MFAQPFTTVSLWEMIQINSDRLARAISYLANTHRYLQSGERELIRSRGYGQVTPKRLGKDAEQWAAKAGTHFRFLKNAHRKHAMHRHQEYDEETVGLGNRSLRPPSVYGCPISLLRDASLSRIAVRLDPDQGTRRRLPR